LTIIWLYIVKDIQHKMATVAI